MSCTPHIMGFGARRSVTGNGQGTDASKEAFSTVFNAEGSDEMNARTNTGNRGTRKSVLRQAEALGKRYGRKDGRLCLKNEGKMPLKYIGEMAECYSQDLPNFPEYNTATSELLDSVPELRNDFDFRTDFWEAIYRGYGIAFKESYKKAVSKKNTKK